MRRLRVFGWRGDVPAVTQGTPFHGHTVTSNENENANRRRLSAKQPRPCARRLAVPRIRVRAASRFVAVPSVGPHRLESLLGAMIVDDLKQKETDKCLLFGKSLHQASGRATSRSTAFSKTRGALCVSLRLGCSEKTLYSAAGPYTRDAGNLGAPWRRRPRRSRNTSPTTDPSMRR
jgi:hypothetical protein